MTLYDTFRESKMTLYDTFRENHCLLFFTALTFWSLLFYLFYSILSSLRRSKSLSHLIRTYIAEACVSSAQGFVCGGIGLLAVLSCRYNVMEDKYDLIVFYCDIGSGYFVYDVIAMFSSNYQMMKSSGYKMSFYNICSNYASNHALIVAHHIILVLVLFPALITFSGMGHFFAGSFFCMELSSPLVNFRGVLSKLQLKRTTLYVINGVTMMIVFVFCRVLIFPFMYVTYCVQTASLHTITIIDAFSRIPLICHLCCTIVLLPQIYWLSLMVRGVVALFTRQPNIIDKLD